MKEINTELTRQEMYRKVNKCVWPLLPEFKVVEKRGNENKKAALDYSVPFRSIIGIQSQVHGLPDPEQHDSRNSR